MRQPKSPASKGFTREHSIWVSRAVILIVVTAALSSYFYQPVGILAITLDLLFRCYLHFVAGGMAHEGSHGHLGNSRQANLWWGRLALVPTTVPYVTFRHTHLHHHSHTNLPGQDPDAFLDTHHKWQIPFRAVAMPHQWVFWMKRHGKFGRKERIEYVLTYVAYFAIYATIAYFVGTPRVLTGLLGSAVLHSMLLWYLFAIKTHEGYSTGTAEERSHNYAGKALYWFSFGLSMHQLHHLKPRLSWLEMGAHVKPAPLLRQLRFQTDRKAAS